MRGNNIPFVMLGAGLLWFGWFGFNAGSALTAGNLASYAWVNTNTATATALHRLDRSSEKLRYGKSTALGAASGAVAGLVAITPCAGFVSPIGSIFIGLLRRLDLRLRDQPEEQVRLRRLARRGRRALRRRLDRHAVRRLLQHHRHQRARRTTASSTAAAASTVAGTCCCTSSSRPERSRSSRSSARSSSRKVIGLFFKNRVTEEAELEGLDIAIHGESAYDFGPLGGVGAGDYVPAATSTKESVDA